MSAAPDVRLLRAALGGDGGAFGELVRPEYPNAYRLAHWFLRDEHEAEDAVQDAALRAWRKLATFKPGSPFRPWFLAIVANQCRSRRQARWLPAPGHEPAASAMEDPDLAASLDLHRGLMRLRYEDRLVLVLRYYLDLPFDDIAAAVGVTEKAARIRVERAVHRLRPMLRMQEVMG